MVFETVLADVLNKYLRPYVKKLDNSQLKIGVWKGIGCSFVKIYLIIHLRKRQFRQVGAKGGSVCKFK